MLHLIFMWLIKGLFMGMAFIFGDVVEKLELSADGLIDLVPGLAGFHPTAILSSVTMAVSIVVITVSLYKAIVSALFSPLSDNVKENPAVAVIRCFLAGALIMMAPVIIDYAWLVLRTLMDWIRESIQLTGFGTEAATEATFSDWINMYGNTAWAESLGSEVVSLIWAAILFYEVCMASIIYIERYVIFGIMLAVYPVGVSFAADKDNSSAFLEWLKVVIGQGAAIIISYAMFRAFEAEIAFMISSAYTEGEPYSKTLMYCVMIALLSLVKNSEKILKAFNINTFPTGETARMIGGGLGRTMAIAAMTTRMIGGAVAGREGLASAGRLDSRHGLTNSMRLSSASGRKTGTGTAVGLSGPGAGALSNRTIGQDLGKNVFDKQTARGDSHLPSNSAMIHQRLESSRAMKEAGIKGYGQAFKDGGLVGVARTYQARAGFREGFAAAKQETEHASMKAYASLFSNGTDGHGMHFDTGSNIAGMSSANSISASDAGTAFKLQERMGNSMSITVGTNAVAGGFHEIQDGQISDIGYISLAEKTVPADVMYQANGYFISADVEGRNGAVEQQTLFLSEADYKAGDIIDGGIVGKSKYDLGDGLWGYIMKSPEELNSDWNQVQEAIHQGQENTDDE